MSTKAKTGNELIEATARAGGATAGLDLPREVREGLSDEVIDQLLAGAQSEEEIVGPGGVLAQLTKRLVERALHAELTEHLGYELHQEPPGGTGNTRNGSTAKTLVTAWVGADRDAAGPQTRRLSRNSWARDSGASKASTTRSGRERSPGG